MKNVIMYLFSFLFILFLFCCENPDSTTPTPTDTPLGQYPDVSVNASIEGAGIILTWNTDVEISGFAVFRRAGASTFVELEEITGNGSSYIDKNCPMDTSLSYYIQFTTLANTKFDSLPSDPIVISAIGITAFIVNMDIRLYWDVQEEVEEIHIFRRIKDFPGSREEIAVLFENTNFFIDSDVTLNTEFVYSLEVIFLNKSINFSSDSNAIIIFDIIVKNVNSSILKYTGQIMTT